MENNPLSECPFPFNLYFRDLTNNLVIIFNRDCEIIYFNQRVAEMTPYPEQELPGKKMIDIFDLSQDTIQLEQLDGEQEYVRANMEFTISPAGITRKFNCFIFKVEKNYCLIGEQFEKENQAILNKISHLNNELANKTRDLTRKNEKLQKAKKKIEKLNRTDDLTGLSNRRHFMDFFKKMFAQAQRHDSPLSLVMADLDKFKHINDTYGHSCGDKVLSAVGNVFLEETRQEDLAARIGGEEFAVILVQTKPEQAQNYADRIRTRIEQLQYESIPETITISLGISQLRREDENPDQILKRADTALYKAKNTGRNRVYIYDNFHEH